MTDPTNATLMQQYEGSRLAVAAYAAQDIKALLSTNPSAHQLSAGFHSALVKQGFNLDQANSFVEKYTPVAAFDQDGAGAVLFRVNETNQVATAIRGTDWENNLTNDLVLADGTIAQGQLPTYQTTLIANFVLRETTPAGQPVAQFAVQGIGSNTADFARATADTLASAGGEQGDAPHLVTMPVLVQTGTVMGTGRAVGPCVDAAAHSEGSPEITTLGSAIAQCARITTVNGPGVSVPQMQSMADQITAQVGLPAQNLSAQNQLNIHTTGVSIIDDLNGGLPGDQTLLNIPTSYGGAVGSHSSIVSMNAAEAQYKASLGEGLTDYGEITVTATRLPPEPHSGPTFSEFLDNQAGTSTPLTPLQQTALAAQLDQLGFGGESDLSFHSLPGGGALIANADGDIVGELVHSSSGDLNLRATAIDASGHAVEVNQHISEQGNVQTQAEYNAQSGQATQQQASAMFNSLMAAGQWDHLSDLGKLSALVNLYNATDKLGEAFGASGDNLPGDLGSAAGWLSLAQGIDNGDGLLIANAVNILSDRALDNALDAAFSNSAAGEAAGEAVPYLSYALAIRNFADNPEQATLTIVKTHWGKVANEEIFRSVA